MRQRMLMAVLIGMLGMLGCIASMSTATNTSTRPKSYRAAVMRVLDTQRVDYHDVEVIDGCAPSYQLCRFYIGKVRIMAATTMSGQIDCRERWITCSITIPQAGSGVPRWMTRSTHWRRAGKISMGSFCSGFGQPLMASRSTIEHTIGGIGSRAHRARANNWAIRRHIVHGSHAIVEQAPLTKRLEQPIRRHAGVAGAVEEGEESEETAQLGQQRRGQQPTDCQK